MISVSELAIYPLKSSRQVSVEEALIGSTGFIHDRQWLLVDEENNKFMTQRHFPEMVKFAPLSGKMDWVLKLSTGISPYLCRNHS